MATNLATASRHSRWIPRCHDGNCQLRTDVKSARFLYQPPHHRHFRRALLNHASPIALPII